MIHLKRDLLGQIDHQRTVLKHKKSTLAKIEASLNKIRKVPDPPICSEVDPDALRDYVDKRSRLHQWAKERKLAKSRLQEQLDRLQQSASDVELEASRMLLERLRSRNLDISSRPVASDLQTRIRAMLSRLDSFDPENILAELDTLVLVKFPDSSLQAPRDESAVPHLHTENARPIPTLDKDLQIHGVKHEKSEIPLPAPPSSLFPPHPMASPPHAHDTSPALPDPISDASEICASSHNSEPESPRLVQIQIEEGMTTLSPDDNCSLLCIDSCTSDSSLDQEWTIDEFEDINIVDILDCQENISLGEQYCRAVHELLASECRYINNMNILWEIFAVPLRAKMTESDWKLVFGNISHMVRVHEKFLSSITTGQTKVIDLARINFHNLPQMVLNFVSSLELYKQQCSRQSSVLKTISGLCESTSGFQNTLDSLSLDERCKNLDLGSYLLEPLQRLTRYPLLLAQILKYCQGLCGSNQGFDDTNPDNPFVMDPFQSLETVLRSWTSTWKRTTEYAKALVQQTNCMTREFENELELKVMGPRLVIKHQLNPTSQTPDVPLDRWYSLDTTTKRSLVETLDIMSETCGSDRRVLIKYGPVMCKGARLCMWLFNDMLFFTFLEIRDGEFATLAGFPIEKYRSRFPAQGKYASPLIIYKRIFLLESTSVCKSTKRESNMCLDCESKRFELELDCRSERDCWVDEIQRVLEIHMKPEPLCTPKHGRFLEILLSSLNVKTRSERMYPYLKMKLGDVSLTSKINNENPWDTAFSFKGEKLVMEYPDSCHLLHIWAYNYRKFQRSILLGSLDFSLDWLDYCAENTPTDLITIQLNSGAVLGVSFKFWRQ